MRSTLKTMPTRAKAVYGGISALCHSALVILVVLSIAVVTVSSIPTSVLANGKESSAHEDDSSMHQSRKSHDEAASNPTESQNQISVLQKRGANPFMYNDLDYSGNSIPHGGMWDDLEGPLAGQLPPGGMGRENQVRNYDLLASLLSAPPPLLPSQVFYGEPVSPSVSYPVAFYGLGDRVKRMIATGRNQHHPLRLKRSPNKMTPADALSLLALLESREPYPAMLDYLPPANGPNDVLSYSPNSVYQNDRSLGSVGPVAPYSDADGDWMNTWTEPAVDYLGFPLDVDTLSRLDGYGAKPSKNVPGFYHQKRFMITKRKRSVNQNANDDCKNNGKSCLFKTHVQPSKVSSV
ncbi:uncharacterized protein LOC129727459 [Wyeomyia smithii]|uniref:uncharacterized protein LOC129727459 n=1 Tax=Wyeomyia smithii TaxID=174621 RepID=UPI002467EA97|nr:uncharacterized protein LOC129727459 [Wyeomyia smithii]XP_055541290.1 uncharacterized protein LOC129727459 [Wyeomyia smithii]XP_055541291.1 uncharacterized protein LOC129727459 [Wyeomyia smithii]XP_055541292.1 uncharacterized protein LOC129727459 [Wyeomyia smithii]XP_055541293.1 uncharacterized protein LOC129727459 [Wyeomyia smithii]XP_055541294.1 uncharacterized protein LOC129727459 [Wyeomyia smithii]